MATALHEEFEGLTVNIDAPNIVADLLMSEDEQTLTQGELLLNRLASQICNDFDSAWASNEKRRQGHAADWKIFQGEIGAKKPPFDEMAQLHYPVALENIMRLWFRGVGELFGDLSNVFGYEPIGEDDREQAQLIGAHSNWQLREKIPDFYRQQARGMLLYYHHGDVVFESYRDPQRRCNRHVALTDDEFYMPSASLSTLSDLSDVPFYGRIRHYFPHQLEHFRSLWWGVDRMLERMPTGDEEPQGEMKKAVSEIHRTELPDDGPAPYIVLTHYFHVRMPRQPRARFFKAVVDKADTRLLALSLHEAESWEEIDRHNQELSQYKAYAVQKQQATQASDSILAQVDLGGLDDEQASNLGGVLAQMGPQPERPKWMGAEDRMPDPPRKEPVRNFTHSVFIEPLQGVYGFGFGRLMADMNRVVDSGINHLLDASTMENFPAYLATGDVNLDRLKIGPGHINRITGIEGQKLSEAIMPMTLAKPSGALFELIKHTDERAQQGIQSPDVLSGASGKSGETAQGILARIGEATKTLSVGTRAYAYQALTPVLKQNVRLNGIWLPPEEVFRISNHLPGAERFAAVGREMYRRTDRNIIIASDLKFKPDAAKIAEADGMIQMALAVPYLSQNAHLMYELFRRSFVAHGMEAMVPLLGERPQGNPAPFMTNVMQVLMQQAQQQMQQQQPQGQPQQAGQGAENGRGEQGGPAAMA